MSRITTVAQHALVTVLVGLSVAAQLFALVLVKLAKPIDGHLANGATPAPA